MIFAIVLLVVGAALAVIGFNLMKPKSGDVPVGGGAYVNAGPEERSAAAKEAGRIMLGIGLTMASTTMASYVVNLWCRETRAP